MFIISSPIVNGAVGETVEREVGLNIGVLTRLVHVQLNAETRLITGVQHPVLPEYDCSNTASVFSP